MARQYENSNLENYFNKYISQMSVANEYKPLLVEILLRRSSQYELTPEEIKSDVETLMYSLDEIKYCKIDREGVAGSYYPFERKIELNKGIVKEDSENMFAVLSHEVYHALTKERDGSDRLGGINQFTGYRNNILLEAFVEKASYKTVYPTEQNNKYNYSINYNSKGYQDITFIVDAIEATYGVNEQDILRNSIHSREKLADFLSSSINESKEDTMKFLDEIEVSYTRLHSIRYRKNEEITPQEEVDEIKDSLASIKMTCAEKMSHRIRLSNPKNMEEAEKITENLKFDTNKLNLIFDERGDFFDYVLESKYNQKFNIMEDVNKKSYLGARLNMNRIDEMSQILRCKR